MEQPILRVSDLNVTFPTHRGRLRAVCGVGFQIGEGRTIGIVGESGCGKSAMATALMRLHPDTAEISGSVLFRGQDVMRLPVNGREMNALRGGGMAMIFQEPSRALFPMKTIGDHLVECVRLHDEKDKKKAEAIAIKLLGQVGIREPEQRFDDYPHQFSGGMAQRAMIAMALAGHPSLLIADEPTTALDVTIQAQVLRLMKELQKSRSMAILFISHDMGVIAQIADEVMVMYLGYVVEHAPVRALFSAPLHPYTQALIASIPTPDKKAKRLETIEGSVPLPIGDRAGCCFADRCRGAIPGVCNAAEPPAVTKDGHTVRCHLYGEGKPWSH